MDELMEARQTLKAAAAELGQPKFTLMPLMVKAASLALTRHPLLNSSISACGSQLVVKARSHTRKALTRAPI